MLVFRSSHSRSPRTHDDNVDDDMWTDHHVQSTSRSASTGILPSSTHLHQPHSQKGVEMMHLRRRRKNHETNNAPSNYSLYLLLGGCFGIWYSIHYQHCNHVHDPRYGSTPPSFMNHDHEFQGKRSTRNIPKRTTDQPHISSSTTTTDTTMNRNDKKHHENDGWQTIHVYHGPLQTDNTYQERDENSNSPLKWYSQAHQDEVILGLLRNRTRGYYIDLAANDAIELSNTYALEKYYHWTGLCIEPNPIYWYNLSYYRRHCHIVGAVVGNISSPQEEIYFRFHAGDHGGIANDGFNNGKRWQQESQRRYTVPLVDILQRFQAPHVIDYLSLDVEGAETYILHNFPFTNSSTDRNNLRTVTNTTSITTSSYHIQVMTAERLRGTIRQYIKDHQYQFIQKLTKWGESLWVHENYVDYQDDTSTMTTKHENNSILPALDWSILNQYSFPI